MSRTHETESVGQTEVYVQLQGPVYEAIQHGGVFDDSKTFVDCIPENDPQTIIEIFEEERQRDDFDLQQFVAEHFTLPQEIEPTAHQPRNIEMAEHIQQLWEELSRPAHENIAPLSTLIPLIRPYVIPGGRFREIYYWDSYFECEGLAACDNIGAVEDMVRNCAYLIERFGFIPNGNRLYYLSRSQPPVFAHMLSVLERHNGTDAAVSYLDHLEKEYRFWMDGKDLLADEGDSLHRRVASLGEETVLNRYWDDRAEPRPEAHHEDVSLAERVDEGRQAELFRDIRAACESGWDFSSRWLAADEMQSICTTKILPVDLNALLYFMEQKLASLFEHVGDDEKASYYREAVERREEAFDEYFWDDENGFYFDYHWQDRQRTDTWSLAAVAPLFVGLASQEQADAVAERLEEQFLHDGGLATTLTETGEQWDKPNGWAPLHWMAINGLLRYGHTTLASEISQRWLQLNEDVFNRTGKMMEKYNVVDITLEAGGGEYKLQDGFGWTNGVAIALMKNEFVVDIAEPVVAKM